jgi:hypothetical protein
LNQGVNKFAVEFSNRHIEWLCDMVEEQGKQLKLRVSAY